MDSGREWFCRLAGVISDKDGLEERVKRGSGKKIRDRGWKAQETFSSHNILCFQECDKRVGRAHKTFL